MDVKMAIERLSQAERAALESLDLHEFKQGPAGEDEVPPRVREKLAEAAQGRFFPSDRADIEKILATLG